VATARASRSKRRRGVGAILRMASLRRLCGELQDWRSDDDLKVLQAAKGSAVVLPFVKGLMLSAKLIYVLRGELSEMGLEVDWGHLLDDKEESCSPECDIIIHEKGHAGQWNGDEDPVMNFKFIKRSAAVAVISCKSGPTVDKEYATNLRPYVKNVFLFVECCAPDKVASLHKKAKGAGYAGFGYLYGFDSKTGIITTDPKAWLSFLDTVKSKAKRARRQT